MDLPAYFTATERGFEPQAYAVSLWSDHQLNGPAICGILARALENEFATDGVQPTRLTVDLFSPARTEPLTVATSLVRGGNRIRVADATVLQNGVAVARASAVFLKPSSQPDGEVWTRDTHPHAPAEHSDTPVIPLWGSDASGWSRIITEHQNSSRKRGWQYPINIVQGEPPSPFVRAAVVGEWTSMMTNWGDHGIGFINADLTLALARSPIGPEIGIEADNHLSSDGIAVGTATLFDRHGPFGSAMTTAVVNARRNIDFTAVDISPEARLKQPHR